MRPGLMIRGKVIIPPSRIDTTGPNPGLGYRFLSKTNVKVNGYFRSDVVAYDQDEGVVMVRPFDPNDRGLAPQIIQGTIEVRPADYAA